MTTAKQIPRAASSSSRALSPVRAPLSNSPPHPKMPSPRNSPAIRPQSPLSPRFETSARFDPLIQPSSPRNISARPGNTQRRVNPNALKLPSLPRFHPSNFPSPQSSAQSTPDAGPTSPQIPASPRVHQRVISDAQKHLFAYQREMVSAARSSTPVHYDNPESPRLQPLGSPGPVTPLQLEGDGGDYLAAGPRRNASQTLLSDELVNRLLQEQHGRQYNSSSWQSSR